MTNEERAKAIAEQIVDACYKSPFARYESKQGWVAFMAPLLAAELAAREREVWALIIKEISKNETVSPHIGPLWNAGWTERSQSLLKWCRKQAAGVQ